ncbi:MAG: type II secretion system protein, partial [Pseudomonadota bacterium]|nr:type II secretion system protein [Pseudomonadota bacterium]
MVELAVVLGIVALVLGALLPLFTAQAANARISLTRAHQDAIRAALITYVGRNGYLPCPADGYLAATSSLYGHEARGAAVTGTPVLPPPLCTQLSTKAAPNPVTSKLYDTASFNAAIPSVTIYRGVLPWLDLGLPEDVVNDGWNQRISYVVSSLGVSGYATREAISGMLGGLVMCNGTGSGSVLLTPAAVPAAMQGTPNQPCTDSANTKPLISTQSAAVALISHGENGFGAFVPPQNPASNNGGTVKPWGTQASAAETANIDLGKNALVQTAYSRSFDDIVLWLTPNDL